MNILIPAEMTSMIIPIKIKCKKNSESHFAFLVCYTKLEKNNEKFILLFAVYDPKVNKM